MVCAFEGMKGLFQGIGLTMACKILVNAACFLTWVSFPNPLDYTFKPNILPY
jgi:hypothetical protein